jgi:hypothetical protein
MENDNNRYANGKIYCLRSHQTDDIYIGSTIQPLYKRLHQHKGDKKNELANYDDMYIELIEPYPCKNRMELGRKEGEHIRSNDCVNKRIEGRTKKEWCDDNKDKILENKKQYRIANKDKIKQYYVTNKNKILQRKNQYNIDNKDKNLKRQKQYYIDNRDKILEKEKKRYIAKKQSISSLT